MGLFGSNIDKEFEEMAAMNKWFGENLTKLPLAYQIKYLSALMEFHESTKSLYVSALMLIGSGEDKEDK